MGSEKHRVMEIEVGYKAIAVLCAVVVLILVWKVLNWAWLKPKRLERRLRRQGLKGNPYRLLVGDLREASVLLQEAMSKPIPLNHDIVPRVMPIIHNTIQKYGTKSFTWVGRIPRIHIMDPQLVKDILTHSNIFQKNFVIHNPLTKFLLTGLGSYEGPKWAKHRKILSPAFHLEKLKHMLPSFEMCCNELVDKWEKIASAEGWIEVDVSTAFDILTSDVISRVAFGSSYSEGGKIFTLLKELTDLTLLVMNSVYIPGWSYLPTKTNKRMKQINSEIEDWFRNIIERRVKAMESGEARENDLLGIMLESNFQEIQKQGNKRNVGMSIYDVIEECKMFYFVGEETTAILLTWTMVLLSQHQEWQVRAREEVLQVFGKNKLSYDGINQLKLASMILHEVLRLYPPIADLTKIVRKETKLGDLTIPAGAQVMMPMIMLHREKEIWGEDAMEFNPMRFADGVVNATKNQVCYIPFSWGPRGCIGQIFALLQAKVGLAMILQRFSFELSPTYAHAPFTVISLQPQHGAHLIFRKL